MNNHLKALLGVGAFVSVLALLYWQIYLYSPKKTLVPKSETSQIQQLSVVYENIYKKLNSDNNSDNNESEKKEILTYNSGNLNFDLLKNKIVIVNFWASWCTPCVEEIPSLINLVKSDQNVVILAVSGDENKEDMEVFLKSFLEFKKAPIYIITENSKKWMELFAISKLPESFIYDSRGEFVKKITGTISWHSPEALSYFKTLLKK